MRFYYGKYVFILNKRFYLCGRKTMLMTVMMIALALNGGMYLGTIAWSAHQASIFGKGIDLLTNTRPFILK